MGGIFNTAQVCTNGHTITSAIQEAPERMSKFCSTCGAPTIMACQTCSTALRGYYDANGVLVLDDYHPPRFCHECSRPFPWTEARVAALLQLTQEFEGLTDADREALRTGIDDLIRETPRTEVAAVRVKKILRKVGDGVLQAFKNLAVEVLTESAKKALGLGPP